MESAISPVAALACAACGATSNDAAPTEPDPPPLPGAALRGGMPVDPDATEPEVPDAIARRGAR